MEFDIKQNEWQFDRYGNPSLIITGSRVTGEAATVASEPLAQRDGPLDIHPIPNGPLRVKGNLEVISGTGRTITRMTEAWFCRCGQSGNKPFCDGTHKKVGFRSDPQDP